MISGSIDVSASVCAVSGAVRIGAALVESVSPISLGRSGPSWFRCRENIHQSKRVTGGLVTVGRD